MKQLTISDLAILKLMAIHCLQCKEGVSGLRDSDEYQVAGSLVMCECS